jgi:hypothetical protein
VNNGHGHVVPRDDGAKARCGGPALCSVCAHELSMLGKPTDTIEEWENSLPGPEVKETAQRIFGKADWLYDHEPGVYIPCCSRWKMIGGKPQKCGNGPLSREEVKTDTCQAGPHMVNVPV